MSAAPLACPLSKRSVRAPEKSYSDPWASLFQRTELYSALDRRGSAEAPIADDEIRRKFGSASNLSAFVGITGHVISTGTVEVDGNFFHQVCTPMLSSIARYLAFKDSDAGRLASTWRCWLPTFFT